MKKTSLSEAKIQLGSRVNTVGSTDRQVLITMRGRPVAMVAGFDEYQGRKETAYILSDKKLVLPIRKGLKDSNAVTSYTLGELLKATG
jgi:prevent-host-death family protein